MPLDLHRPRDLGQILGTAFSLYGRYFALFGAIALLVVVPVDTVFYGLIGGRLAGYDEAPPPGPEAIANFGSLLIAVPLITGMHVAALLAVAEGRRPTILQTVDAGAAKFLPLLGTVLLVGVLTLLGLVALIVGAIYVSVRLWVSAPAVVVEDRGPVDAVRRSWGLVKGNWWRMLGITIVTSLIATIGALLLAIPVEAVAASAESGPLSLVGQFIIDTVTMSFQALTATLLFFDLRARHAAAPGWGEAGQVPGAGQPPYSAQPPYAPQPGYAPPPGSGPPPQTPPPGPYGGPEAPPAGPERP